MSGRNKLKVEGWVDDLVGKNDRLNSFEIWAVFLLGPMSEGSGKLQQQNGHQHWLNLMLIYFTYETKFRNTILLFTLDLNSNAVS